MEILKNIVLVFLPEDARMAGDLALRHGAIDEIHARGPTQNWRIDAVAASDASQAFLKREGINISQCGFTIRQGYRGHGADDRCQGAGRTIGFALS